jgi:uroporphyrinogen decarboxylase
MNVYEIKERYGRNLRLWGGLGTQQVLPFGTSEEVRTEIRHLITGLGRGGGYILAPAKPLMQEVPTKNAVAVIEEFSRQ